MTRLLALMVTMSVTAGCGGSDSPPRGGTPVPGAERTPETAALESGANALQAKAPVEKIAMYLDGFHVSKDDPTMQMEAHHYCNQVNEDLAQCVLFDGNTGDARMTGIEYIISEKLYGTLPAAEKAYWHPHNYEILSGQLRLPGLPDAAEKEALRRKINSYGKTWHTWMAGMPGRPPDALPLGAARLQWSFNRDGEADPGMLAERDRRMRLDSHAAREQRADLVPLAKPQGGVDVLARHFTAAKALRGVADNGDRATYAVPTLELKPPPPAISSREPATPALAPD